MFSPRSRNLWLGALFVLLVACSALAPPKSFDEQIAYAYGTHTAVLNTAAAAVASGSLSPEDGKKVLQIADQSKGILDAARAAEAGGDLKNAQSQLQLATNLLQQVLAYLNAQGAKK